VFSAVIEIIIKYSYNISSKHIQAANNLYNKNRYKNGTNGTGEQQTDLQKAYLTIRFINHYSGTFKIFDIII